MLVAAVVDLHGHHHGYNPGGRPSHLPEQEVVARPVALLGHDRRSAEYHHQSQEYQDQGDGKQPAVDANTLGHGEFISPRRHKDTEKNVCEFPRCSVTILVPPGKRPMWARAPRSCGELAQATWGQPPRGYPVERSSTVFCFPLEAAELRSAGQPGRLSPRVLGRFQKEHERGARAHIG